MKKFIAVMLTIILILNIHIVSFANIDDSNYEYTHLLSDEIQIIKDEITDDVTLNAKEDEFLVSCGMDEKWVKGIPDDYKMYLFENCEEYGSKVEYCIENGDGDISVISREQYEEKQLEMEMASILATNTVNFVQPLATTITDTYFKKTITWLKTNDNTGYYAFFVTYEWIKLPIVRSIDVITLTASDGAFKAYSSGAYFTYSQTTTQSGSVTTRTLEFSYDEYSDAYYGDNRVAYEFDMPNDVPGVSIAVTNNNVAVMVFAGFNVTHPQLITNFTLYGNYFHRTMALGSSFSLSNDGAEIAISPSLYYKQYTISESLKYTPN